MDQLFYKDAICEVNTMENEFLFVGNITGVSEEKSLTFDIASKKNEPLMILAYGAPVKLKVRADGESSFMGGYVYWSNEDLCRITNITTHQDFERRSFFRVKTDATCNVKKLDMEEDDEQEIFTANLIDISLSGVKFRSNAYFRSNAFFQKYEDIELFDLSIIESSPALSFMCKIVDMQSLGDNEFIYRCELADVDTKTSNQLNKCIFALEREAIRKRKNRD